jgi:cytochrome c-type biogenesis protein CcmF
VLNNLLLSVILGIVFIGTLYPLIAQAMGQQLSIGAPFFNKASVPVALALVVATMAGPMLTGRKDKWSALGSKMMLPVAAMVTVVVILMVAMPGTHIVPLLGLAAAAGLAVASLVPLAGRNLRRTPLHIYGMVVAHVGVAVSIAGMAADTAFKQERLAAIRIGETVHVGPFAAKLTEVRPVIGENWSALEATLSVRRNDGAPFRLQPQQRYFSQPVTTTSEAAISTMVDGQLYSVLGAASDAQGRYQIRLWWKPFVTFIWLGGFLIAFGGLMALAGRVRRERRPGEDEA